MNNAIKIFLILLAVAIVAIIVIDYRNNQADKRGGNPFEYDMDNYKSVDEEWIKYKETRQLKLNAMRMGGIAYNNQKLYLVADDFLQVLSKQGGSLYKASLGDTATCIAVRNDTLVIGFNNHIRHFILSNDLKEISRTDMFSDRSFFTSVDFDNHHIYVADAGERAVVVFNKECQEISRFTGVSDPGSQHGFIIPSPYFDLRVNGDNELWVTNPGKHALQCYSPKGDLLNQWKKASVKIDGFTGCCNPAHFTILDNGNFITSEKGLVRIKEYDRKGNLLAVVGAPDKFNTEEGKAPDVTSDEDGTVIALDYDKKMIRF